MDGAKIHCHPMISYFLRSLGIIPVFLPAYCPFYNQIEILFSQVKKALQRNYKEGITDILDLISRVMQSFKNADLTKTFEYCGYGPRGFDPGVAYGNSELSEK